MFVCLWRVGLTILCLGIVLLTLCAWWFGRCCYSFGLACGFHFNSVVVLRYGTACVVVGLLMGVCILVLGAVGLFASFCCLLVCGGAFVLVVWIGFVCLSSFAGWVCVDCDLDDGGLVCGVGWVLVGFGFVFAGDGVLGVCCAGLLCVVVGGGWFWCCFWCLV